MDRADLQRLSRLRLQETRGLFRLKQYSGAYYLAGYAVECALKACIAKNTRRFDFPEKDLVNRSYSHDLKKLLEAANLAEALQKAMREDQKLEASWTVVNEWSEQSRYEIWSREDAEQLMDALIRTQGGVLPWI